MGVFRVVISGLMYGQLVQNVIHLTKPDTVFLTDGADLANKIRDNWISGTQGIKNLETTDVTWNKIQVYDAENPGLSPVELTINISGVDGNGATQIMSFTAYVLRIRATTNGRHGRGRVYIPAPKFGAFINGVLSAASITNFAPVLAQLNGAFVGSASTGFNIGIWASISGVNQFIAAESITMASSAGVQRRRNIGVGA